MKSGCKINEGVIRYDFEIQPSFDRSGRNLPLRNECLCAGELWHPEQRAACTSDAFKLCSSNIPDAAKVETCLRQNKSGLSNACRSVFEQGTGPLASKSRD
jgi:hypothetical protein